MRFWLGGYTADSGGEATGIGVLQAGGADDRSAGGPLGFTGEAAAVDSPSWLTAHPSLDVLYAALEGVGAVQAFRRTGETSFVALGGPVAAGKATCHVAVAPDGRSLIASCWGDGRVVRMTVDAAGRPSSPVAAPAAVDPYSGETGEADAAAAARAVDLSAEARAVDLSAAARALREAAGEEFRHLIPDLGEEESHGETDGAAVEADAGAPAGAAEATRPSHAHEAVFLPGGVVATTDMGLDLVRFWRAGTSRLEPLQQVVLPRGSGPRHMVWHPSGHLYVLAELSCEVYVLNRDASGRWMLVSGTPVGHGTLPGDTAAELAPSRDGMVLYAGVRGSNTIAAIAVRGDGSTLAPVALVESGVDWPRHHTVVRDILLVGGQRSNDVVSLTLDVRTGVPGRVRHRTAAPSPTCILPDR